MPKKYKDFRQLPLNFSTSMVIFLKNSVLFCQIILVHFTFRCFFIKSNIFGLTIIFFKLAKIRKASYNLYRSVFSEQELEEFWNKKKNNLLVVNFIYVKSLSKRLTLEYLWDNGIISFPDGPRPFTRLSDGRVIVMSAAFRCGSLSARAPDSRFSSKIIPLRLPEAGSFCIVFFRFQHRRRNCFSS